MNARYSIYVAALITFGTVAHQFAAPFAKGTDGSRSTASTCPANFTVAVSGVFGNALEGTNGNKVVVGRDHRIHIVYRDSSQNNIFYRSSGDGLVWSVPVAFSSAGSGSPIVVNPTIAVDAGGTLGVVFVVQNSSDIYYTYKPYGGATFSAPVKIAVGQQPSMVGVGGRMYLAWAYGFGVSYTDFPSTSPPSGVTMGHVVIQTTLCTYNTTFSWPSIAVMVPRCGGAPIIKIAMLYFSDERQNPYGCPQPNVKNGVYVLNACPLCYSSFAYGDITIIANPPANTPIQGVSVSLTADSSRFYLAWSDVFGAARTMFVSGTGSLNWPSAIQIASKASTVDVAVEQGGSEFRVAWNEMSGLSAPAFYRGGTWQPGSSVPSWSSAAQPLASTGYSMNPQAVFWRSCKGSTLTSVPVVYENGTMSSTIRNDVVNCPANCSVATLPGPLSDC